jgi:hypothetical protein
MQYSQEELSALGKNIPHLCGKECRCACDKAGNAL